MEASSIPALPETTKTLSDDGKIKVAVAVDSILGWTLLSHHIIGGAMAAGLRRAEIDFDSSGFFKEDFSVSLFTFRRGDWPGAFQALKQTLSELALLSTSHVAMRTDDAVWLAVEGWGKGGIGFDGKYLRPEDIAGALAHLAQVIRPQIERKILAMLTDMASQPKESTGTADTGSPDASAGPASENPS